MIAASHRFFTLRKTIVLFGIIALAAVASFLIRRAMAPQIQAVQIGEVRRGNLTAQVAAPGKIKAVSEVKVSAFVMGPVTVLPVEEGQQVKKGQLLVQIDPKPYRAQAQQAEANLNLAQTTLTQSKSVWERKSQLFSEKLISQEEKDQAETQYHADAARVQQAKAALDQARDQYSKTSLRSPINGVVTQLNVELGEVVVTGTMNIPGSIIMLVSNLNEMEVEADVDESDIRDIRVHQKTSIEVDALPGQKFSGHVTEVGNAPEQTVSATANTTVNYPVKIRVDGDKTGLKPGMSANVDITTAEDQGVLIVPIQALVTRPVDGKNREVVYACENNRAVLLPVTTGISDVENIEIEKGLTEGRSIIIGSFDVLRKLKDGDPVKPAPKKPEKD